MFKAVSRPLTRTVFIASLAYAAGAFAAPLEEIPDVVVTADRVEEPIGQTGASVTLVKAAEIDKLGTKGVADTLRSVAGVDVDEVGGVGSTTRLRLRGAGPGETLVLIDGVRVGDPSSTDGSLDFGTLSAVDIERIEVLRGPQSALYGSDAMGGVVNIITRKGTKTTRRSVTVEAGSYGTLSTRATLSGGDDRWTYSLGVSALHTDGFPRYGYRIGRPLTIGDGVTPLPPLPSGDWTNKGGLSGRFSYRASDMVTLDFGLSAHGDALRFDNPFAFHAADVFNPYNVSRAWMGDAFARATIDPGGVLKSQITAFGNVTTTNIWEMEGCYTAAFTPFACRSGYRGGRFGAEYQGDLKLGAYGALTFGARNETETAHTEESPDPHDGSFTPIGARQTTNSVFAEHRITLADRLDLTLGGRIDAIESGKTFATWRATAAYRIDETGTKLRASAGSGAKAPTLFQQFSPFGSANLAPEQSVGVDAGIDQKLLDGRLTASATVFDTRYRDLIAFAGVPSCTPAQLVAGGGCYYNVGRAEMRGVELSLDAALAPDVLRLRAAYTYLDARDLDQMKQILREPRNKASLSLIYDPTSKLEIEPRLTLVGARRDIDFSTGKDVTLAGYAKIDFLASYKVNDNLTAFGRLENLTDVRYEEVYNYGTAGRSVYAGLTYAW